MSDERSEPGSELNSQEESEPTEPESGVVLSLTDFIDQLEQRAFLRSLENRSGPVWAARHSNDTEQKIQYLIDCSGAETMACAEAFRK